MECDVLGQGTPMLSTSYHTMCSSLKTVTGWMGRGHMATNVSSVSRLVMWKPKEA